MFRRISFFAFVLAILATFLIILFPGDTKPQIVLKPKELIENKEQYMDHRITINVSSCELVNGGLIYRQHTSKPPLIIFIFNQKLMHPVKLVSGICRVEPDSPIILINCYAVE
jgi:hypothetical protein